MNNKEIAWDHRKRDRLRVSYTAARAAHAESFMFDGHFMLVAYAQYLLEYLDQQLRKTPK